MRAIIELVVVLVCLSVGPLGWAMLLPSLFMVVRHFNTVDRLAKTKQDLGDARASRQSPLVETNPYWRAS